MMNSYIWSSDAELWKHLFIWSMERLSKSSYWIPFFRHSKNSCWKTERVQGKKGCWSGTQGKVPQQWAREVEKRCWEREKEENWWPVWEGSEMEAQAVESPKNDRKPSTGFSNSFLPLQTIPNPVWWCCCNPEEDDRQTKSGSGRPGCMETHQGPYKGQNSLQNEVVSKALESINIEAPPDDSWPSQWAEQYFSSDWKREGWLRLISMHTHVWAILNEYITL